MGDGGLGCGVLGIKLLLFIVIITPETIKGIRSKTTRRLLSHRDVDRFCRTVCRFRF